MRAALIGLTCLAAALLTCGCDRSTQPAEPVSGPAVAQHSATAQAPSGPIVLPEPTAKVRSGGTTIEVPAGSSLVIEHETEGEDVGAGLATRRIASSEGAGLTTTAPEVAADFDSSAPLTALSGDEGGSASGGGTSMSLSLKGMKPSNPLLWIGGVVFLAGGFMLYRGQLLAAGMCVGVASVMIAMAMFPAVAIVLSVAALAVLALVYTGHIAVRGKQATETETALAGVLGVVETLPEKTRLAVKSSAKALPPKAKATITRIKRVHSLPSERP